MARKVHEMKNVRPIRIEGDTAIVTLSRGFEAIIDVVDVPLAAGRNWSAKPDSAPYAYRQVVEAGKQRGIFLHRLIAGAQPGDTVDHIDGNVLNNRRENLRLCTARENFCNRGPTKGNPLGYVGVSEPTPGRYAAAINHDGRYYRLGTFPTPEEASAAYYGAARVLRGAFARKQRAI